MAVWEKNKLSQKAIEEKGLHSQFTMASQSSPRKTKFRTSGGEKKVTTKGGSSGGMGETNQRFRGAAIIITIGTKRLLNEKLAEKNHTSKLGEAKHTIFRVVQKKGGARNAVATPSIWKRKKDTMMSTRQGTGKEISKVNRGWGK